MAIKQEMTVLLVDDDPAFAKYTEILLKEAGFSIISAHTKEEGIAFYEKYKPHIVILDIFLPDGSGVDLIKPIRKDNNNLPILMVSGQSDTEEVIRAMKDGANDYLKKPFHGEELILKIQMVQENNSPNKNISARAADISTLLTKRELDVYKNLTYDLGIQNRELKKLLREPQHLTDKNKIILSATVHGLNGEFVIIGGYLAFIRNTEGNIEDLKNNCDIIERSLQYCEFLLQRLRDYYRIGKISLRPTNVQEVIIKTESLLRPRLRPNVQLNVDIASSVKRRKVIATSEQLMEVFVEITQNASRALESKGGIIDIRADVNNKHVIVTINDNGPGIPPKIQKDIFMKQIKSNSGLGIGLFLCKRVIKSFGGELKLTSGPLHGTTVSIALPFKKIKR